MGGIVDVPGGEFLPGVIEALPAPGPVHCVLVVGGALLVVISSANPEVPERSHYLNIINGSIIEFILNDLSLLY